LQRLFSTFTNGWPGKGLLLLRATIFAFLIQDGIRAVAESGGLKQQVLHIIAAALGMFLIAGIFTPVAGMLAAVVELWLAASHQGELWPSLMAASIASGLAMLGPGDWSMDAHLFGRKRISIPDR
jgi:putative oxidoreductase